MIDASYSVGEYVTTRVLWDHERPILHPDAAPESYEHQPTGCLTPSPDMSSDDLILKPGSGAKVAEIMSRLKVSSPFLANVGIFCHLLTGSRGRTLNEPRK